MIGKRTIISCLLPAYLLLVIHAIIPHHHHHGGGERPIQFHHESDHHHDDALMHHEHHDPHDDACCEKAHHFAHAPESDEAMITPGIKRIAFQFAKSIPGYLLNAITPDALESTYVDAFQDKIRCQFTSLYTVSAHTLRGPPMSSTIA